MSGPPGPLLRQEVTVCFNRSHAAISLSGPSCGWVHSAPCLPGGLLVSSEGVINMLPCQSTCPVYREGCHKTCPRWSRFLETQQAQRQSKKAYLQFYNARCSQELHQYLAMQARYIKR